MDSSIKAYSDNRWTQGPDRCSDGRLAKYGAQTNFLPIFKTYFMLSASKNYIVQVLVGPVHTVHPWDFLTFQCQKKNLS